MVNVALLRAAGTSWPVSNTVVGVEQALDLVFFAVAIPVATVSALVPLGPVVPNLPGSSYVVFITVTLLVTFSFWIDRHFIVAALHAFVRAMCWFQSSQKQIDEFIFELRAQIDTLRYGIARRNVALLLLMAFQWLIRDGVLWLMLLDLGHHVPFKFLLVLQAVGLHLAQWIGIPAGGGGADLGLAAALGPRVTGPTMATSLLLWRFSTLYIPLLVGVLSLAVLTCKRRSHEIATTEIRN